MLFEPSVAAIISRHTVLAYQPTKAGQGVLSVFFSLHPPAASRLRQSKTNLRRETEEGGGEVS